MRSKSEMRYTVYRMSNVLYLLKLMDWNTYREARYDAWDAYAVDAYNKRLREIENEDT